MDRDPYEVLGISPDATEEEIKTAYRKKAKEYHPDLHPDDPAAQEKMNEVNAAYDLLQDPEKYRQWKYQQACSQTDNQPYGAGTQNPYGGYSGSYGQGGQYYWYDFEDENGTRYYRTYNPYGQSGPEYDRSGYGRKTQSPIGMLFEAFPFLRRVLQLIGFVIFIRLLSGIFAIFRFFFFFL